MSTSLPGPCTVKGNFVHLSMPSATLIFGFSSSILIAGVIACIRFRQINNIYYPFLYCVWIGCVNEIINFFQYISHNTTAVNNNIYVLVEAVLLTWLFKNLGLFKKSKWLFYTIIVACTLLWLYETFILRTIYLTSVYYRIICSFITIFLSITIINQIISRNTKGVLKNATFLLCVGFIIYYTYKILVYAFWLYAAGSSKTFFIKLFTIMIYINLLANLIYALAILWMPRKIPYSQRF